MHICLECGGKLKVIAKTGRLTWDGNDLYEIPPEIKITTCINCGQPLEDAFLRAKLKKSIEAQKRVAPGMKLMMLRWVDERLDAMFQRTRMWAHDGSSLITQVLLLLEFRELVLSKGAADRSADLVDHMQKFLGKRFPEKGNLFCPPNIDLDTELAPALKEFCDVWIMTA